MLVGDEKQTIYGFNGSDSRLMTDSFVANANKIEQSDSVSNYYYDGEIKAFSFSDEKEEALFILERIQQLLQFGHKDIENNLEYNNFAIIARNKYVFREIESLLRQKQIPFYYKKTISGIDNESDYMKIFDLSMRMLINPKYIIHLRELKKLLNVSMDKIGEFDTGLELLHDLFENSPYFDMLMALKDISGDNFDFSKALGIINSHISGTLNISDEEKYLVCNDIKQWQIHWKKYTSMVQREQRSLISFRNHISLGKTQDISQDSGIALLTAHMSKGLQYEVVFIIGLTEGTFPDYRAINTGGREMEQEKTICMSQSLERKGYAI